MTAQCKFWTVFDSSSMNGESTPIPPVGSALIDVVDQSDATPLRIVCDGKLMPENPFPLVMGTSKCYVTHPSDPSNPHKYIPFISAYVILPDDAKKKLPTTLTPNYSFTC
jgi:hypothetical protein